MLPRLDSKQILQFRGPRTPTAPAAPPALVTEIEPDQNRSPKQATTVFLIGKECPFRCLMCDLWKHTTDVAPPPGSLVQQLNTVLPQIPHRDIIKLYNASNFFDPQAVSAQDLVGLAELVQDFEWVVVENHPKLLSTKITEFAARLHGQLQVAMGLETADEQILARLNKQMTVSDYDRACDFLIEHDISIRTFLLLPAPGVAGENVVSHTISSVRHALACGSHVTSLIPLRTGNGALDWLLEQHLVHLPDQHLAAKTFRAALDLPRSKEQRLFLDLWNFDSLAKDDETASSLHDQMERLNLRQA